MGSKPKFLLIVLLICGVAFLAREQLATSVRQRAERDRQEAQPEVDAAHWFLEGDVTDESGAGLPGVETQVVVARFDGRMERVGQARTDEHGHYRIDVGAQRAENGARGGYVSVHAPLHLPGFAPFRFQAQQAASGELTVHCDVTLRQGATVRGRAVDANGKPVPWAIIGRRPEEATGLVCVAPVGSADADGWFATGLPEGRWRIVVRAPGLLSGVSEIVQQDPGRDVILEDIVLREGLSIEGRVEYEDGTPVAGVRIGCDVAEATQPQLAGSAHGAHTDEEGRFRITGLEEGRHHLVLENCLAAGRTAFTDVMAGESEARITVALRRVRIRIRDQHGDPLSAAYLRLVTWPARPIGRIGPLAPERDFFIERDVRWGFEAELEGRHPAEQIVEPDERQNEIILTLTLPPRVGSARLRVALFGTDGRRIREFSGRVLTPLTGRTLASFAQSTQDAEPPSVEVPAGAVRVELSAGDGRISCYGAVSIDLDLEQGEERLIELEAPAGGRLRLEIRADDDRMAGCRAFLTPVAGGEPLELRGFYELRSGAWGETSALTAGQPAVSTRLLEPGRYALRVELPGHEAAVTDVSIVALAITDALVEPRPSER